MGAFDEERRNEFANNMEEMTTRFSALQSVEMGEAAVNTEEAEPLRVSETLREFLEMPMNDRREAVMKKLLASAVTLGASVGTLPFELPDKSPVAIASAVDESLTRMKTALFTC